MPKHFLYSLHSQKFVENGLKARENRTVQNRYPIPFEQPSSAPAATSFHSLLTQKDNPHRVREALRQGRLQDKSA